MYSTCLLQDILNYGSDRRVRPHRPESVRTASIFSSMNVRPAQMPPVRQRSSIPDAPDAFTPRTSTPTIVTQTPARQTPPVVHPTPARQPGPVVHPTPAAPVSTASQGAQPRPTSFAAPDASAAGASTAGARPGAGNATGKGKAGPNTPSKGGKRPHEPPAATTASAATGTGERLSPTGPPRDKRPTRPSQAPPAGQVAVPLSQMTLASSGPASTQQEEETQSVASNGGNGGPAAGRSATVSVTALSEASGSQALEMTIGPGEVDPRRFPRQAAFEEWLPDEPDDIPDYLTNPVAFNEFYRMFARLVNIFPH